MYAVFTGIIAVLHLFVVKEFERGAAEKSNNAVENEEKSDLKATDDASDAEPSSAFGDVWAITKVKSYTLSNFAFAGVSCVTECGMVYSALESEF